MEKNNHPGDLGWLLILLFFIFGLWFLALPALFLKLYGPDVKHSAPPPLGQTRPGQQTAQGSVRQGRQAASGSRSAYGPWTAHGPQADSGPRAGSGSQAGSGPQAGSDSQAGFGPQAGSGPRAGSGSWAGPGPRASSGPQAGPGPRAGSGPQAASGSRAAYGPWTASGPQADSVRRAAQQSADSVRRAARQSADSVWKAAASVQQAAASAQQTARQSAQWRQSAKQTRASQKRTAKAVKQVTKSPKLKRSNAFLLKLCGVFLSVFGILGMVSAGEEALLWEFEEFRFWLPELLRYAALTVGGSAMLFSGLSMDRQLKRYGKYLLVMGDREAMPIEELARTLGFSERRVEKDLQKMIDKGYFGGKAYLNVELGYLFRSSTAGEQVRKQNQTQEASEPPKETDEGYSGILRSIRRANDRIADPVLSAKIDRLEEITAKIFRAVEEDPKKAARIDTFLNYYLPTTQKLLNSYASFEAAGVEGENLRQAKQRIETTMDSIVEGFEHQLDELYQADALDIDTDIRVMEHMLRRDTASAAQDFQVQEEGEEE